MEFFTHPKSRWHSTKLASAGLVRLNLVIFVFQKILYKISNNQLKYFPTIGILLPIPKALGLTLNTGAV
jgi:hypothetical protein